MSDVLADKGQGDRAHISTKDERDLRLWAKKLGLSTSELERLIDKVGNSVAAVKKEMQANSNKIT